MRKLLPILGLLWASVAWAGTCGSGYSYRKALVIPYPHGLSGAVTNFPWSFCFNGACVGDDHSLPDLKTIANGGKIQNTAANSISVTGPADLVFCDAASAGNALSYESDAVYSATTGKAVFYVKIPSISNTVDTVIWMFYGNASVSTSQQDLTNTWSNGYVDIYHFGDGSTLSLKDSIGGHDLTNSNVTAVASAFGGGANFNGTNASFTATAGTTAVTSVSMEMWMNNQAGSALRPHIVELGNAGSGWGIMTNDGSTCTAGFFVTGYDRGVACNLGGATGGTLSNRYRYYALTVGSTSVWHMYGNGVSAGSSTSGISAYAATLSIGYSGFDDIFKGILDEVRISNVERSADWEKVMADQSFQVLDSSTPSGLVSGSYCIPVTIDHTKVTATQSNFQVLFRGIYPWLATIANSGFAANSNGYDIRWFSNSSCTSSLSFERVYYTATTGDAAFFILVPSVSNTSDTTIYVSVGNAAFSTDASSTVPFSSNGWVGRYHLGSPTSVGHSDSGSAGLTLTDYNGTPTANRGPIGGAIYSATASADPALVWTNNTGDHLSLHGYPMGTNAKSSCAWGKLSPLSQGGASAGSLNLAGIGDTDVQNWQFTFGTENDGGTGVVGDGGKNALCVFGDVFLGPNSPNCEASSQKNSGTQPYSSPYIKVSQDYGWHQICSTVAASKTLGDVSVYIDGTAVSPLYNYVSGTSTNSINTADTPGGTCGSPPIDPCGLIEIGGESVGSDSRWIGYTGDYGVYNGVLSADYISTSYNNQSAPYSFYSLGTAAPSGGAAVKHRVIRH